MLGDHFKVFRVSFRLIEFSDVVVENAGDFEWRIKRLNTRQISEIPIKKLFILTSSFHPCIVFMIWQKVTKWRKPVFLA